jgi:hypothetical protein
MHMLHRGHRLAARVLAVGLLAATLYAVDSLAFPDTAEARCAGTGNPVRSTFSYAGTVRVSETPVTGTCNNNQLYQGILKDEYRDGRCVSVLFKEADMVDWEIAETVCGVGETTPFEWRDRNDNSRVYQTFCAVDPGANPAAVCGWGTQASTIVGRYYGTNYGF